MKLLLLSDLHCDPAKLNWAAEHTPSFDAVVVSGDLLNIFMPASAEWQEGTILEWKARLLASGASLIWCSGNHDFFHGVDSPLRHASPHWMCGSAHNFFGDGVTGLLRTKTGSLAVTSIPWPVTGADIVIGDRSISYIDYIAHLLDEGKKLQLAHPWLVLFHEPPIGTRLCVDYSFAEARLSRQIVEKWKPDLAQHGHIHEAATHRDGDFFEQLGSTVCFNAGQSPDGDDPHHIVLQLKGRDWNAQWRGGTESRSAGGVLIR